MFDLTESGAKRCATDKIEADTEESRSASSTGECRCSINPFISTK